MTDEHAIRNAVAEALLVEPNELALDTELESLAGYDSVARLTLMVCLSDLTGRPFEPRSLERLRTFGDIVNAVDGGNGRP